MTDNEQIDEAAVEEGWYPDPDDESGSWLRYWDGEDWSPIPPKLASAREREELSWPDPPLAPGPRTLADANEIALGEVLLLGGHGYPLIPRSRYDLGFDQDEVVVSGPEAQGEDALHIPYRELTNLSIGGPGAIREGGGFVGGGFGLEGFAIGAAAASVLNAATTKSRIETLIGLQDQTGELIFLCTTIDPRQLELQLSRARAVVRSNSANGGDQADVATQLTKLADLLDRGLLERAEFDALKRKLLSE